MAKTAAARDRRTTKDQPEPHSLARTFAPGSRVAQGGRTRSDPTSLHTMTRFLLTWIAFATLPLGVSRGGSAAELRAGGESTRPVLQLEACSSDVLARTESGSTDLRPTHIPPLASSGAARLDLKPISVGPLAQEPGRSGPPSRVFLLPEARAPPA